MRASMPEDEAALRRRDYDHDPSIARRVAAIENMIPHLAQQTAELAVTTRRLEESQDAMRAELRALPEHIGLQFESVFTRVIDDDKRIERFGEHMRVAFMRHGKMAAGGWVLGVLKSGWTWALTLLILAKVMGWGPAWEAMKNIKP
jgi:hypothetical protein